MKAVLKHKERITERDFLYTFECPEIASKAVPGQFAEISVSTDCEPFLRRPFSFFDAGSDAFSFLVRTVGKGTKMMSLWQPGFETDVIGPLGNGFTIFPDDRRVLLAAGGIGLAPLYYLARVLKQHGVKLTLLFSPRREKELLKCISDLDLSAISFCENRHELPSLTRSLLESGSFDRVYTCGPEGFLKTVAEAGEQVKVPVQVSVEARMACGFGVCMGCVIPIRDKDGFTYKRVCSEGPVFDGREVIWDE